MPVRLRKASPAKQKYVLGDLIAGDELGRDRDISLHLKLGGPNRGSLKTNFPPNRRGSGGSTSWCSKENVSRTMILDVEVKEFQ